MRSRGERRGIRAQAVRRAHEEGRWRERAEGRAPWPPAAAAGRRRGQDRGRLRSRATMQAIADRLTEDGIATSQGGRRRYAFRSVLARAGALRRGRESSRPK